MAIWMRQHVMLFSLSLSFFFVRRDFGIPMSAFATVTRESFSSKLLQNLVGHFMLPLLMLTSEVGSLSIHYLISIWTTCWCNLNKIAWSKPTPNYTKFLCFLTNRWRPFGWRFCNWNNCMMLKYTVKKSVNFTVKYWQPFCQQITVKITVYCKN